MIWGLGGWGVGGTPVVCPGNDAKRRSQLSRLRRGLRPVSGVCVAQRGQHLQGYSSGMEGVGSHALVERDE